MSATKSSAFAATVLAVPVLAEIAWPSRLDTAGALVLFAASQLVGWALLAWLVLGAPPAARAASPRGRRAVLVGCALQVSFATAYGVTAFDGEPLEASFVLFMLGFITLFVGGLLWASSLRRRTGGRVAAAGLLAVSVLGALAILVGGDPFHDIFLVSSYVAWIIVGHGFDALRSSLTVLDGNTPALTSSWNEDGTTDAAGARAAQGTDQATPRS